MTPKRAKPVHLETFDTDVRILEREANLNCPKCHANLERVRLGTLEIERCTDCQGLWFDVLEWDDARAREDSERLDGDDVTAIESRNLDRIVVHCPKCRTTPLTRLEIPTHPGLHIDKCPRCYGAFFDAGEFLEYRELSFSERIKKFLRLA
jgi:uncharacterized protein